MKRPTNEAHFESDLRSSPTVLVKFTAAWCPPCRALAPTLAALATDRPDLLVLTVDVDAEQALAQRYRVLGVPTLIAFRNGQPVGQLNGNQPRARIETLISA